MSLDSMKNSYKSKIKTIKKHKVIKFSQQAWLKMYIDTNIESSTRAKNDIETYFKLMNKLKRQ